MVIASLAAACSLCRAGHGRDAACGRLQQLEATLELLGVPAYLSDHLNRFVRVNREFARLVGDPEAEGLPPDLRFIHAVVIGPWRDRFEQTPELVASCLPSLVREIDAGRVSSFARVLVDRTVSMDADVRRALSSPRRSWNGSVVVTRGKNSRLAIREQVTPVLDDAGNSTGYHVGLWFPADAEMPTGKQAPAGAKAGLSSLTPRQLEFARLFAQGLGYREVAAMAGVSPSTARSHLEGVYDRLGVHSRAQMVALLIREGAV